MDAQTRKHGAAVAADFAGRVALVTGSCIGLGAAIAERLAAGGARVVITGYPVERGQALAAKLPHGALFIPADLRDAAATVGLAKKAIAEAGGIDILVNNAAVSQRAPLGSVTPELFDTQFHIIARAPILLAQAALDTLKARKGVIVNIGSVNSTVGWPDLLTYAAAKGALVTASKNMANALQHARVRVYCLNPGWIDTEGERALMTRMGHPPDFLDREGEKFPLKRLMKPEEVAEVVAFFASEKAAPFSGAVVELEQFPLGGLHPPMERES
jgi:NAD(P)-dependent dehydrogenase (short-subunit alcohol dehydrogenase family)